MNILLAYASRHGSTREIAEAIVEEIRRAGFDVVLSDVRDIESLSGFDVVIIGTAVYLGQWLGDARAFVDRFELDLRNRPVWIFSSGPIGEDPFPKSDSPESLQMLNRLDAVAHKSFLGKLDRSALGLGESIVSRVVRAPEGDFRDWQEIRGWARSVAEELNNPQGSVITEYAV